MKKNEVLSSKLEIVLKENNSLKNKIALISKELDLVSKENTSLKNNLDSHICYATIASSYSVSIAYSTSSSNDENDIIMLKKSVDCLGSTLSQCAMDHKKLESIFRKKHAPQFMHTIHGIHMLIMITHMTRCMFMCTLVHIVDVRATLQKFVMID